jgi:hypothetical protein
MTEQTEHDEREVVESCSNLLRVSENEERATPEHAPTDRTLATLQRDQAGDMEGMVTTSGQTIRNVSQDRIQANGANFFTQFLFIVIPSLDLRN